MEKYISTELVIRRQKKKKFFGEELQCLAPGICVTKNNSFPKQAISLGKKCQNENMVYDFPKENLIICFANYTIIMESNAKH